MNALLTRSSWLVCCVLILVIGCEKPSPQPAGTVSVAVSIQPQAWLLDRLAGGRMKVISVLRPGVSPATYQPTDAQVSTVMKAEAYFRIGAPFENGPWFAAISSADRLQIIDLRKGIELRAIDAHHHEGEGDEHEEVHANDPHIWLSPHLLKIQANTAAEALIRLDPVRANEIRVKLRRLIEELNELDVRIRERLDPFAGRAFLVFHPAWGYFADEYGLRQIAIEIEGKEPTDRELTVLQELAHRESMSVVFVQPQIAGRAAAAIAEAIGGRVETLDPLAPDVASNLLNAAETIAASFEQEPPR